MFRLIEARMWQGSPVAPYALAALRAYHLRINKTIVGHKMKTDRKIDFSHDASHFIQIESIERFEDGSGFSSILTMQSGSFSCQGHSFYFDHLEQFAKDLAKLNRKLKGKAELGPDYEPEFIRFVATELGRITVQGELTDHGDHRQLLKFSFATDQSYLPGFLESVETALESLK